MQCCLLFYAYRETVSNANNKPQHGAHSAFDSLACASCTLIMKFGERQREGVVRRTKQKREMQWASVHITIYGGVCFMLGADSLSRALSLISTTALHLFLSCFLPFSFERAESCAQPKTVMLAGFISKSRATFFATNRLLSERSDLFSYSAWFLIVWLTKLSIFFALIQVIFCWAQGWLAFVHNFHLKRFIFKLHVIKCESLNKTKV